MTETSKAAAPIAGRDGAPGGQWAHDPRVSFSEESNAYIYRSDDGISFEYDAAKAAWFPQYNEALVQSQQLAYGGVEEEAQGQTIQPAVASKDKRKHKDRDAENPTKRQKGSSSSSNAATSNEQKKRNTAVYVTGLPFNATVDQVKQVFSKCGIILEDPTTQAPKIKLYKDSNGDFKGDALVIFLKEESVKLAIDLLDDSVFDYQDGGKIRVQKVCLLAYLLLGGVDRFDRDCFD
eukprot:jgi/Hompol1/115/HPOL_005228-RA